MKVKCHYVWCRNNDCRNFVQNFCQRLIIIALENTLRNIQNLNIWQMLLTKKFLLKTKKMSYSIKCWS